MIFDLLRGTLFSGSQVWQGLRGHAFRLKLANGLRRHRKIVRNRSASRAD